MNEFEMFDIGFMHYFLGIIVIQSKYVIFLSQRYIGELFNMFQMKDCKVLCTLVECGTKLH